ncbi:MAG: hypothetical protein IJA66_01005 [Alistipes sp.]|nr:hypothetical protein [Alistipes sp.]
MDNNYKNTTDVLTYALNELGQLVHIDSVPNGMHCNCICPACKEPLVAKNGGLKKIHHFAHQSGASCLYAAETILHLLAKTKIQEVFLSQSEYCIEYTYKSYCINEKECQFRRYGDCYQSETKRFNLKQFYDSCEQEIVYDNINRRSDLKIYSSNDPTRKPIYLEFCVTHASDAKKLHSGNKIIEIKIDSNEDIVKLAQEGIKESNKNSFYGFKKSDYKNSSISRYIEFYRYILYKSGKTMCYEDASSCNELIKKYPYSLLELCIHNWNSEVFDRVKHYGYKQFRLPNCSLCSNYVQNYNLSGKICRLYKRLQIPRNEKIDTSRAKDCCYFKINSDKIDLVSENDIRADCTIFR